MQSSMKRNSSFSSMLAATAIALSGGVFSAAAANDSNNITPTGRIVEGGKQAPMRGMSMQQELQAMRGLFQGAVRSQRYPRPGYSVKQGQRMARKVSNKARNRRAHR